MRLSSCAASSSTSCRAGFVKIRHCGLLANRCRTERLATARRLLLVEAVAAALDEARAGERLALEPARERCCERCGSRRLECVPLPREPVNTS